MRGALIASFVIASIAQVSIVDAGSGEPGSGEPASSEPASSEPAKSDPATSEPGDGRAPHQSGGEQLPRDPGAVSDEGARAMAMAKEVEAAAKSPPADVATSLGRTRQALSRAHGAHAAGDSRTARLLGKVALGWAETAKAQLAAARAEKASGEVEKAAADLGARRDRGRALVTESQARKGQLASQIERKKHEVEAAKAPKSDKKPDARRTPAAKPAPKPADAKAPKKGAQP